MFSVVSLVALVCSAASPDVCTEKVLTTSELSGISMTTCAVQGEQVMAEWANQHPGYVMRSWRCEYGQRRRGA